jgi:hypothetical protein
VADLLVPLGQAVITGALLAGVVVYIAARRDYDGDLLTLWAGVGLPASTLVWLVLLFDSRRLLRVVETLTGLDLDRDGHVGKPKERVVIVNAARGQVEAAQRENAQRQSQFARWVAQLPTRGTAARTWERELGRETYQEWRDSLIRLGWAKWNSLRADGTPNERKGWTLVLPAAEILRRVSV